MAWSPINLGDFCYFFSLQVGIIAISCMGFTVMCITVIVNIIDDNPETNEDIRFCHYMVVYGLTVLGFVSYTLGLASAHRLSDMCALIAGGLNAILLFFWLFVLLLSFRNDAELNRYICIYNRCADRLFIQDALWRKYGNYLKNGTHSSRELIYRVRKGRYAMPERQALTRNDSEMSYDDAQNMSMSGIEEYKSIHDVDNNVSVRDNMLHGIVKELPPVTNKSRRGYSVTTRTNNRTSIIESLLKADVSAFEKRVPGNPVKLIETFDGEQLRKELPKFSKLNYKERRYYFALSIVCSVFILVFFFYGTLVHLSYRTELKKHKKEAEGIVRAPNLPDQINCTIS